VTIGALPSCHASKHEGYRTMVQQRGFIRSKRARAA
jgi:hypothetical protein